jgi:hypothetical protein
MGNEFTSVSRLRIEIDALLREFPELADDEVARFDTLDGSTDVRDVLIRLARALDDTKALQQGVQARLAELEGREARFDARGEFIRELIFKLMAGANFKKVELPEATLSLRNNPRRLVGDADPATLPDNLVKVTRAVNRKAIREAIESGHAVEGFALSNAPPSLVVMVK